MSTETTTSISIMVVKDGSTQYEITSNGEHFLLHVLTVRGSRKKEIKEPVVRGIRILKDQHQDCVLAILEAILPDLV